MPEPDVRPPGDGRPRIRSGPAVFFRSWRNEGMTYRPRDFSALLGMDGFSNQLLEDHFQLYQGYVKETNLLQDKLKAMTADGKLDSPEHAELRRRLGWEFNGMRLHELYFGNLGGDGRPPASGMLFDGIFRGSGGLEF